MRICNERCPGVIFTGVIFTGITATIRDRERRDFGCEVEKTTWFETKCYSKYDKKYNSPLPFYLFVIFSFLAVLVVHIVYSILVTSRVVANTSEQAQDDDEEANLTTTQQRSRRVCYAYVLHLFVRFCLGILSTVLQYTLFYSDGFDSEFTCVLEAESKPTCTCTCTQTTNVTRQPFNFISTNCHNPSGLKKTVCNTIVAVLNIIFALIALGEAIYIAHKVWKSKKAGTGFEYDSKFCKDYFLQKRQDTSESSVQIPLVSIGSGPRVDHDEIPSVSTNPPVDPLTELIEVHKKKVLDSQRQTDIHIGTITISLNDMYVDVIIHGGRVAHKFTKNIERHEVYEAYLKPPQGSIRINNTKGLFIANKDTNGKTPKTILVVGRPGIGKTSLCSKIMLDWATAETDEFYSGKIIFTLKFRWFNRQKDGEMNLKELLRYGTKVDDATFEDTFQVVSDDPTKAIIIFDGLDESKDKDSCFEDEEKVQDDSTKKMTFLALFIKLARGLLLRGATVLTTTRPTADHIYTRLDFQRKVEVLGFTQDKVEEYVEKFCKNNGRSDKNMYLWRYIKVSPEILNLCYIPVNCYIVCAALFHNIEELANKTLPKTLTLTEIYKRALNHFSKEHGNLVTSDDMKALEKLAFDGVVKSQLIFEESEVNEHMVNSGFFNSLPNDNPSIGLQYCFVHLTIQEFLAARHVVEWKNSEKICKFISSNVENGQWHLVIQFVAGLLEDQMKDASYKKNVTSCLKGFINSRVNNLQILMMKCLNELKDDDIIKEIAGHEVSKSKDILLYDMGITPADCSAVANFIKHTNLSSTLNIGGNPLGESGCLELSKLLQERCFDSLLVDRCLVNDVGLKSLIRATQETTCKKNHRHFKLTKISLSGNDNITDDGLSFLCEFLKDKHCNLTQLDLSVNTITDNGVSLLCDALKDEHCNLTQLDLSDNGIADNGVSLLCNALEDEHCNLTQLNLSGNEIGDHGVSLLCDALKDEHSNLTKLSLGNNNITDNGVSLLYDALKDEHCNLTQLYLSFNEITDNGAALLRDAIKDKHCNLTEMNI